MKVCVVDPSLFTLAYDQHLCAGLRAVGVDVTLCGRALRAGETLLADEFAFAPHCYPLTEQGGRSGPSGMKAWLKAAEHAWRSFELTSWLRERFDVLHFQWSPLPLIDQWQWKRLARDRAVFFTVHDTTPFLGRPTSRGQQLGWRRLLDAVHGLIVHTETSRLDLLRLGIAPGRITVVPHGPLRPARSADGATTLPRPVADGPRTLLVFGEIKPYKGIDVLLRAAARLPEELAAGWRILIAGRPRCDMAELQELATRSRVAVDWQLGFVPEAEITPLFSSADVAVFPYRRVDASGAFMLALPFGLPIVASRVGVFQETLEDGVTGLLVPPGDEIALAATLERVMRDAGLRVALRANSLAHADRISSWASIARRHASIYQRHLRGGIRAGDVTESHPVSGSESGHPAMMTNRS